MKLTGKILLLLVLVVVVVTAIAGTLTVRSAYASLEERQHSLAAQLADEIQERLATAWRAAGPRGVNRALHDWVEETNQPLVIEFVLFSDEVDRQLQPRVPRDVWPVLRRGQIFSRVAIDDSGSRNLHTYMPIESWNGELGALELTQSLAALDEQTRQLVVGTVMAMSASALLGLALAYVAGVRWVAQPLHALIAHTQQIGRGDFSARTELRSGDELDQLAQALNAMSVRLAEQQATIGRETQERVQALQQLRHADRLGTLGRMAAGIAHELGTPLNVVAGRAALIASGRLPAEEITSSAQTIKAEADRITSIVQRMLDFARQRRPHTSPCDLTMLVDRTLSLLSTMAEKKSIRLELIRPAPGLATICTIDEAQIQQVLTNLIVNAIQATPTAGQVRLTIDSVPETGTVRESDTELASAAQTAWLRVSIEDSGQGVPDDLHERIFEPFFTTKDVGEGTGLGLSIAYGIVQEHHGRLEVTRSDLGGARFEMWFATEHAAPGDTTVN
ncbi:MAG: HAMP domain-containing histidine kinase [Pirellulaceae bacterium]|nr:HAMP domain-containing histidine kinase [Pirellulaceae bacterium]